MSDQISTCMSPPTSRAAPEFRAATPAGRLAGSVRSGGAPAHDRRPEPPPEQRPDLELDKENPAGAASGGLPVRSCPQFRPSEAIYGHVTGWASLLSLTLVSVARPVPLRPEPADRASRSIQEPIHEPQASARRPEAVSRRRGLRPPRARRDL